jgi:hypothetical protein
MLPFGVTIPATVPQGSEIPEGLRKTLYINNTIGATYSAELTSLFLGYMLNSKLI